MIRFVFMTSLVLSTHCTSDDYKELDTSLDTKGQTQSGAIGITDEGKVIIQEQNSAADELRLQQAVNNDLEAKLKWEATELETCRNYLADPRLGGNGEIQPIASIDNLRTINETKEEFGIENGDLKFVRRERFMERLGSERKFEKSLKKMLSTFKQQRKECNQRLGVQRVKAGLPAQPYKGKGYFNKDGTYVETQKHEQSLDDAFRIKADLEKR